MTAAGLRLLQGLRRSLLDPPAQLRRRTVTVTRPANSPQNTKSDEAKRVLGALVAAMDYLLIRASAGDGRHRLGPCGPMADYADGTQVHRYVCWSPARPLPARLRPIL